MKKLFFGAILLLAGCAQVSLPDQFRAEENRLNWAQLTLGMSKQQVKDIMGPPAWVEKTLRGHDHYEAWFYLMNGEILMTEDKYPRKNYTPIIMRDGLLTGWGYPYYNVVFDVLQTRNKFRSEMGNQKDTTEPTDWPEGHQNLLTPSQKQELPSDSCSPNRRMD
jgi:hypothetical protein